MQENTNADLEEQVQAYAPELQAAQQELYQQMTNILESITDAFFAVDRDWRFTYVNSQAESLMQKTRDELLGQNMWDVYPKAIGTTLSHEYHRAMTQKTTVRLEEFCLSLNTWLEAQIYPAKNGLLVYFRDITERKQAEEALYQREHEFRALAENSPDIIARFDKQLRHLYVNAAVELVTGLSTHAFIGKTHRDLGIPEALCTYWEEKLQQIFATGQECIINFDFITPDGTTRHYQSRLVPEFALNGSIKSILNVARDVTKFKQTEASLRESEERFRQLAENIDAVFWVFCLDEQKTLYISPAYEKIWGRSSQPLYEDPQNWMNTIHPEDRTQVITRYERSEQGEFVENVYRIVKQDGSIRWIYDRTFPVFDDQGRLYRRAGIAEDITERKHTEAALKESEQKYRNLVETCQSTIWSVNTEGRLTFINQAAKQIYGYEPEEMIGRHFSELVTSEQEGKGNEIIELILAGGPVFQHEAECVRKDGTTCWVSCNALLLRDNVGNILGVTGTCIDISDRKRVEEQIKASLQEKEVLLKEVHHRVKNNLQVVSSLLDLQSQKIQDSTALEAFQTSYNRIKSIALIHEKLYESKNLARVNLADYIDSLTTHLLQTYLINPNTITLQLRVDYISLGADTLIPLGLIINELIANALEHAFPGNLSGVISLNFALVSPTQYILTVRDNGVELPEDIDFCQTKTLGLQLVYRLTQQLQGSIELERNNGSVFKISFSENEQEVTG